MENPLNTKVFMANRAIVVSFDRPSSYAIAENLVASFCFAWAGIRYSFVTQRNFRIQVIIALVALALSFYLQLSTIHLLIVCLTSLAVLIMELLNTAIEALVDLTVGQSFHQQAKIAKDCAAGAVLVTAIGSVIVAALLLFPPLWQRLMG